MTTASQKRWISAAASTGCIVTGESEIQIHHIFGRKAKHNKIEIGEWAIIPLAIRLHDVGSNHPFNVTHWKKRFEIEFGSQKELLKKLFLKVRRGIDDGSIKISIDDLPPVDVIIAITHYRR